MKQRPSGVVIFASTVLLVVIAIALVGNVFTPYGVNDQDLLNRLKPPAFLGGPAEYPLGTDRIGRDMVARLVAGLQMSLSVALAGTLIGAVFGTTIGFIAAHFRGLVEEGLMMLVDFQASLPFILIALTLLAFFGNSMVLFVILMGLFGWETYARLSRGVVLSAMSQPYAKAVVALGASPPRLYLRHILPNVASALIVQITLTFPQIILLETSLSFLGLGIQPPLTSLGNMLGFGRSYLLTGWWIAVVPGLAIFFWALAVSVIGDWARSVIGRI
jgi:peptide/nickel transport system permease protein